MEGCILCAPVPAATTPRVHFSASGNDSGMEIYRIHTDFPGAETRKGTLNLRSGPGRNYKILAAYKNTLTVQVIAKISASWYEVTAPDGKHGYMDTTYLVYDHTEGTASEAVSSVVDERQLRDQPFRIYRIVPELDQITVYARHVVTSTPIPGNDIGESSARSIADRYLRAHYPRFSEMNFERVEVRHITDDPHIEGGFIAPYYILGFYMEDDQLMYGIEIDAYSGEIKSCSGPGEGAG